MNIPLMVMMGLADRLLNVILMIPMGQADMEWIFTWWWARNRQTGY